MKRKVKITKAPLPKAGAGMNFTAPTAGHPSYTGASVAPSNTDNNGSKEELKINRTLKGVDRDKANLEAEVGETVVTNLNQGGIPEFYTVGGKRHYGGGTPLNLPGDSFIYSRDNKLKVKDGDVLREFGKSVKGKKSKKGFTPADLSKAYDLNKYQQILMDPSSDRMARETAELMIQNNNLKLGKLALYQESMKGFPNEIPVVAMPYMDAAGLRPEDFITPPQQPQQQQAPQMPQGRYGGMPQFKNGGSVKKKRVRITGLPKMQVAGQTPQQVFMQPGIIPQQGRPTSTSVSTSGKTTKVQNIPSDKKKWDPSEDPNFDYSQVKPGDYVKEGNGYKLVKGYKSSAYSGRPVDEIDERLVGDHGDLREAYGRLENQIMNSPELQTAMVEKYKALTKDLKAQGLLSKEDVAAMQNMAPEDIVKTYLAGTKQNYIINAHKGRLGELEGEGGDWDTKLVTVTNPDGTTTKVPAKYKAITEELGFQGLSSAQTGAFQAMYKGMQDLSKDPEFKDELGDYTMYQAGFGDEKYDGEGKGTISKIDGWPGDTTIGQSQLYADTGKELEYEDVAWEEKKEDVQHLDVKARQEIPAEWWLQDEVNLMGAVGDFARVQKEQPWEAQAAFKKATPAIESPERALSAIGSMAQAGARGAATFAGPQAYSGRYAGMQRSAADQAANVIAQTHGRNIQTMNQFEMANTQMFNQHADKKRALATGLYDKYAIANQQFTNAKNQARQQMRQHFNSGVTNAAKTQTMNELYPQYNVDPTRGGTMRFDPSRVTGLDSSNPNTKSASDHARDLMNDFPELSAADALDYATGKKKKPMNTQQSQHDAYLSQYMNAYQQPQ